MLDQLPAIRARLVTCLSAFLLGAFTLFSLFTYYDRLSQYGTMDEDGTWRRLERFVKDPTQYVVTDNSNLSNIAVAIPGSALRRWLDLRFQPNDQLMGNIYYTRVLPYAAVQVTLGLTLIIACTLLVGRLAGWQIRRDLSAHLLFFCLILNVPLLKGECKVLKYDCLSINLSLIALLSYALYRKEGRCGAFYAAVAAAALAYIEKDTSIGVMVFIVAAECAGIYWRGASPGSPLSAGLKMLGKGAVLFLAIPVVMIPRFWVHPYELLALFMPLGSYTVSGRLSIVALSATILIGLLYAFRTHFISFVCRQQRHLTRSRLFAGFVAVFIAGVAYQANDVKWIHSSSSSTQAAKAGYFVGASIANVALTTLDKSRVLTQTKLFFAGIRQIIYFLPEILLLGLVFSPLTIGTVNLAFDQTTRRIIGAFVLIMLSAHAWLLLPPDAKYLTAVIVSCGILAGALLCGGVKGLHERRPAVGALCQMAILASLLVPAWADAPAYFGYMNVFRRRSAEELSSLRVDDYNFWTWTGWGETSYELVQFASRHRFGQRIKVGYDYMAPFHVPNNVTMVDASNIWYFEDPERLNMHISYLVRANQLDFLIISKNTACRNAPLNALLGKLRAKAVHVDRHGGIEWGWLLDASDVLAVCGTEGSSG
jgi:hypothetical protein